MKSLSEIRATIIWHDFHDDLASGNAQSGSVGLPAIHRELGYQAAFDAATGGSSQLQRPWLVADDDVKERSHFWEYHLGDLRTVEAGKAWRLLVPLRRQIDGAVSCTHPGVRARLEVFFHPFGSSTLATVVVSGERSVAEAVDEVVAARKEPVAALRSSGPGARTTTIEHLVDDVQTRTRDERSTASTSAPTEPMVITTVVQGAGIDSQVPLVEGSEEHRAIAALTGTDRAWAQLQPRSLAKSRIDAKGSAGSVLYRQRRGRTVWMPHLFGSPAPSRELGCYHRNLTMLSMYIDSLVALCRWGHEQSSTKGIPAVAASPVREAANALGRLYGFSDTYRSRSATAQIDDSHAVKEIDALRATFGLPKLCAQPASTDA